MATDPVLLRNPNKRPIRVTVEESWQAADSVLPSKEVYSIQTLIHNLDQTIPDVVVARMEVNRGSHRCYRFSHGLAINVPLLDGVL